MRFGGFEKFSGEIMAGRAGRGVMIRERSCRCVFSPTSLTTDENTISYTMRWYSSSIFGHTCTNTSFCNVYQYVYSHHMYHCQVLSCIFLRDPFLEYGSYFCDISLDLPRYSTPVPDTGSPMCLYSVMSHHDTTLVDYVVSGSSPVTTHSQDPTFMRFSDLR